jgi:DNA-binding NtrC family response regulator
MHEHLITLNHLPQTLAIGNQVMTAEPEETILDSFELEENVMRFEKRHIELTLQKCQGNREETARLLGISLRSLYYKIKNLGI